MLNVDSLRVSVGGTLASRLDKLVLSNNYSRTRKVKLDDAAR